MTSTPPATAPPAKAEKPTLAGSRLKQRKGVAKSQAKFEPEVFRDQFNKYIEQVPENDFDALTSAIDKAGNTLDYRKYSDQFFELYFTGGLLAPGGSYLDDDVPLNKLSVFAAKTADLADVKPYISALEKVIRRYKFLQKPLEETNISGLIQYTPRYGEEQRKKLAVASAVLVGMGLASANILLTLQKDHLVKDEVGLRFAETFFRAYLAEQSVEQLGSALRKGGVRDPLLFFPQTRRSQPGLVVTHFRSVGLNQVADYFQRRAIKETRDATAARLREMRGPDIEEDEKVSDPDVVDYLKEQRERSGLAVEDFVPLIWEGLVHIIVWGEGNTDTQALKEVKAMVPILESFCPNAKCEIALINTIQVTCHDDAHFTKAFPNVLKVLYNDDVISDQAILYWAQKGSKPQGRGQFLKAAEPLIKFLEEQSDDEEE